MSTLVRANRLTIKKYTEDEKELAWNKCIQAKQYLAKAFHTPNNKNLVRKALEMYEQSLNIYPEYAEIYIGFAYISYISDDLVNAIAFLHNALYIDSQNIDALNMLEFFKQVLKEKTNVSKTINKANSTLEKVMEIKMPVQSKVMASKGFLTSVKKAFSW